MTARFDLSLSVSRGGVEVSFAERWLAPGIRLVELHGLVGERPTHITSQALESLLYRHRIQVSRVVAEVSLSNLRDALLHRFSGVSLPIAEARLADAWQVSDVQLSRRFPRVHGKGMSGSVCICISGARSDGVPVALWLAPAVQVVGRKLGLTFQPRWVLGLRRADVEESLRNLIDRLSASAFLSVAAGRLEVDVGLCLLATRWLEMGWQLPEMWELTLWALDCDDTTLSLELRRLDHAPEPPAVEPAHRGTRTSRRKHIEATRTRYRENPRPAGDRPRRQAAEGALSGLLADLGREQHIGPEDDPVAELLARATAASENPAGDGQETQQQPNLQNNTLGPVVCDVLAMAQETGDQKFAHTLFSWCAAALWGTSDPLRYQVIERWSTAVPTERAQRLAVIADASHPLARRVERIQHSQRLPGTREQQQLRTVAWGLSLLLHAGDPKAARRVLEPLAHTFILGTGAAKVGLRLWGAVARARAEDDDVVCESVLEALGHVTTCCAALDPSLGDGCTAFVRDQAIETMTARWSARRLQDAENLIACVYKISDRRSPQPWIDALAHAPRALLAQMTQSVQAASSLHVLFASAWMSSLSAASTSGRNAALMREEASCRASLRTALGERLTPHELVEEAWLLGFGLGRVADAMALLEASRARWPRNATIVQALTDLATVDESVSHSTSPGKRNR